jgi:hypothetical protein
MSEPSPFRRMQERAMARLEPLVTVPMTQQAREDLGNAATGLAITSMPAWHKAAAFGCSDEPLVAERVGDRGGAR